MITPLIEQAQHFLEQGQELTPFAFIGDVGKGITVPIQIAADSEDAKDRAARDIERMAAHHNADFVFVIMEAWSLRPDKLHMMKEIYDRYGSIAASPYAIEVASFSLETRDGIWVAQCPIRAKGYSKKKRTIGTPEFKLFTEAAGRFVDLLPLKNPAGRTLH